MPQVRDPGKRDGRGSVWGPPNLQTSHQFSRHVRSPGLRKPEASLPNICGCSQGGDSRSSRSEFPYMEAHSQFRAARRGLSSRMKPKRERSAIRNREERHEDRHVDSRRNTGSRCVAESDSIADSRCGHRRVSRRLALMAVTGFFVTMAAKADSLEAAQGGQVRAMLAGVQVAGGAAGYD